MWLIGLSGGAQTNNMEKPNWKKLQDFTDENKDLLMMIASPKEDSILITFGGLRAFVRFPGKDMSSGVVFNALRQSKFEKAIIPFTTGVANATGFDGSIEGSNIVQSFNGGIKAIGEQRELSKGKVTKKNVKNKS